MAAVAISGNDVYVGGTFARAAALPRPISLTGTGRVGRRSARVNGPVQAVAVSGSDVYVGGTFTQASGGSATNIAHWTGVALDGAR